MTLLQAQYDQRGPVPEALIRAVPLELPAPAAGEVQVAMLASPVNPSALLTITGDYGVLPPLPAIGGNEGIGRVAALGEGVTGLSVGQRVLLPLGSATWVSHLLAPATALVPLPESADPLQLSMLSINPPTAALLLSEFVTLSTGDWVIQNAANSGVGGYLMQIARQRGLRTLNVVRRDAAVAAAQAQGGEHVLVDGDDLAERVRAITGGAEIRLAIDAVGGSATDRLAQCLAVGGTLVNYGMMGGEPCQLSPAALIFRDIQLRGFWLLNWFYRSTSAQQQALYAELTQLIATGVLHAEIEATYPLAQIQDAVAHANRGARAGKILVTGPAY